MAHSKMTLIGMEKFLNPDRSVFDDLILPDDIDKSTLIGTIILRCQEFELLFPDPDFMIAAVNIWGRKNYWTFDRWIKAINKEYDPLYNKDYYEEITDIHNGQYNRSGSGSTSGLDDHTRTDNLKTETDNTDTHSEKAFNDSDFVETTEDILDGEVNQTGTQRNAGSFSTKDNNSESGGNSYTNKHTYHGYGNIGITSAQSLVKQEIEVARFNLYNQIADLFASEFCIVIY